MSLYVVVPIIRVCISFIQPCCNHNMYRPARSKEGELNLEIIFMAPWVIHDTISQVIKLATCESCIPLLTDSHGNTGPRLLLCVKSLTSSELVVMLWSICVRPDHYLAQPRSVSSSMNINYIYHACVSNPHLSTIGIIFRNILEFEPYPLALPHDAF